MVNNQNVAVTCNYSTPYPIPESSPTEYYLYNGINFTINTHYQLTVASELLSVQITRASPNTDQSLFHGVFTAGSPGCQNTWLNRCTHTFVQDSSCDPCDYSVTVSGYDTSTDDIEYVTAVEAFSANESCRVTLTGGTFCVQRRSVTLIQI